MGAVECRAALPNHARNQGGRARQAQPVTFTPSPGWASCCQGAVMADPIPHQRTAADVNRELRTATFLRDVAPTRADWSYIDALLDELHDLNIREQV